jgi:hypothetical protein
MFTPFAFRTKFIQNETPIGLPGTNVEPEWTPADFTDVQNWWRADTNVTEVSGKVSVWEDQINGLQLIQNFTGNAQYTVTERRPVKSTSSTLNSQDTILFDTSSNATYGTVGSYLYGASAPASNSGADVTYLFVMDRLTPPAVNPDGEFFGNGMQNAGTNLMWIDTFNSGGDYRVVTGFVASPFSVIDTGVTPSSDEAIILRYNTSTGATQWARNSTTLSTLTSGTTGGVLSATSRFWVNGYGVNTSGGVNLRFNRFHMAEIVVIYGYPTSTELDNWTSYVNSRYGTIIT